MPVANQNIAKQYKSANDFLLTQQVAQTPTNVSTSQAVGQIAGQQATQAGQQTVQLNAQQTQQGQQLATAALSEQNITNQVNNREAQRVTRDQEFEGEQRLSAISEEARQELFDGRKSLTTESQNFRFLNQRQLADWAIAKGISDEQFRDYQQAEQQAYERKNQMMQTAYNLLRQQLDQAYKSKDVKLQRETEQYLRNLDIQAKEDAESKQQFATVVSGVLKVVGAVGGSFAGPTGATTGAAIGGAIGSGIAAQF